MKKLTVSICLMLVLALCVSVAATAEASSIPDEITYRCSRDGKTTTWKLVEIGFNQRNHYGTYECTECH